MKGWHALGCNYLKGAGTGSAAWLMPHLDRAEAGCLCYFMDLLTIFAITPACSALHLL